MLSLWFLISHGVLGNKNASVPFFSLELRSSKATNTFSPVFSIFLRGGGLFSYARLFFFLRSSGTLGRRKEKKGKASVVVFLSLMRPLPGGSSLGFLICFGCMGRGWEREAIGCLLCIDYILSCIKGTLSFLFPAPIQLLFCYCFGYNSLSSFPCSL